MRTEVVPLGEVATITAGQSPPGHTYNENGVGLPFYQGKADFGEIHPIARKWCEAPKKVAESGDILISVRAPVGPTNVAGERCCIGRGLAAVRPDETVALRDFVLWTLKHREPEIVAKGQGSTFPAIGQRDLKSLRIPLPPLDEQRRIVDILNRAAKIERLRARAQERLREFIPALFVRMFGDPVENPHGWDVALLGEVIEGLQAGKNVKAGTRAARFRILKVSAVTEGDFDPSMSKPSPDNYVAPSHHHVRVGDLLISRANGTPAYVGATAMVEHEVPGVLLPDKLLRFVWREHSLVEPRFVHGLLQTPAMRNVIGEMASGISMKNISQAKLKTLPVLVPPLDLQRRYTQLVETARSAVAVAAAGSRTTSEFSASLMSRLLGDRA